MVENSTYKGGPKSPPTWWNFTTINKGVEKFHPATSTFLGEFFHHLQAGGKIPPYLVKFFHHPQAGGNFFPPSASWWKNSTISKRWKIPPTEVWWNFSTISNEVEKYNHGISTCFGRISHHLQAGGTILPYQGKHLLIIGVPSVNTVEWCAHQCHCLINNQFPIKSLYGPKT